VSINRIQVIWSGTPTVGGGLSTFYTAPAVGTVAQQVAAVAAFLTSTDSQRTTALSWATAPDVAEIDHLTGNLIGVQSVTPVTGTGAAAGDIQPYAVQGLLRLVTNVVVGTRLLRGRLFLPGSVESSNSGVPIAAYQTAYNTAAATLVAAANCEWMVWSRTHGSPQAVVNATTWNKWAVLRSRRD
jgi:hypothetical protein